MLLSGSLLVLVPILLGGLFGYAWHRCGEFESTHTRMLALSSVPLHDSDFAAGEPMEQSSSAASLLKLKALEKLAGGASFHSAADSFTGQIEGDFDAASSSGAGAAGPTASGVADFLSNTLSPRSGERGRYAGLGHTLRSVCSAGYGWRPVVLVLLASLRYLLPVQLGNLLRIAKLVPAELDVATAAMSGGAAAAGAAEGGMLQMLAGLAASQAGGGQQGGQSMLQSLAQYAGSAFAAFAFVKALAFDAALFAVAMVVTGAALDVAGVAPAVAPQP